MSTFKVGDVCRIKSWNKMVRQFGIEHFSCGQMINPNDSIVFTNDMKYLCGQTFTIATKSRDGFYTSVEHIEKGYVIADYMLESANEKTLENFLKTKGGNL